MIAIAREGINIKDNDNALLDIRGLSTDTKPTTGVSNMSSFIEADTGKIYFYDANNKEWVEFSSPTEE